jgi:hypothetical protein
MGVGWTLFALAEVKSVIFRNNKIEYEMNKWGE